jgi:hypothetical protein
MPEAFRISELPADGDLAKLATLGSAGHSKCPEIGADDHERMQRFFRPTNNWTGLHRAGQMRSVASESARD